MLTRLKAGLPPWMLEWLEFIVPAVQILLVIAVAWLLQRLLRRLIERASDHDQFPHELLRPVHAIVHWLIVGATVLLVLERLGVSASVLWSAFTGFAAVGAVAFFAAWSVLSNLFCAFLIFTVGPFRVGDQIELMDTSTDKPGPRGQVVDINLLYTTLEDDSVATGGALLQIPNSLIFQRVVRRWRTGSAAAPAAAATAPVTSLTPYTSPPSAPQASLPATGHDAIEQG